MENKVKVAILRTPENYKEVNEIINKINPYLPLCESKNFVHNHIVGGRYVHDSVKDGYTLVGSVEVFRAACEGREIPENIITAPDPHAEARAWHEKGGQVEFINHANSSHKEWEMCDKPEWSSSCVYRPYTHGLEVGMPVPEEILNKWEKIDGNEVGSESSLLWIGPLKISSFEINDGEIFFLCNRNKNALVRAAGFLDFWKSFESKKEEEAPKEWPLNTWLYGFFYGVSFIFKSTEIKDGNYFYSEICSDKPFNGSLAPSISSQYIKRVATNEDIESIFSIVLERMGYRKHNDTIVMGGGLIYENGQFATIVQPEQPVIESVPESKEEMFTQEELIWLNRRIYNDQFENIHAHNMELKIQSLIQPEPVPPVAGDIYCYNENVGYAAYGIEGWHLNTSAYGSTKIVDVPKQDWHKLTLLKPK